MSAAVRERRQWKKFIHLGEGETTANVNSATAVSVEEIFLERGEHTKRPSSPQTPPSILSCHRPAIPQPLTPTSQPPSSRAPAVRVQSKSEVEKLQDPLSALGNTNASLLVCRICGKKGDHWTSKCPYKDLAASKGMTLVRASREFTVYFLTVTHFRLRFACRACGMGRG